VSRYVVDASVIIKWLEPQRDAEQNVAEALELLFAYKRGTVNILQPVHWLAEVAAVLARISPITAKEDLADLLTFDIPIADTPEIWCTAVELAIALSHHLFDTLYHAVTLQTEGAQLITADRRYFERARDRGRILLLDDLGKCLPP
jgi:predicted nucleic acid-binding protein